MPLALPADKTQNPYETLMALLASDLPDLAELIDEEGKDQRLYSDRVAQFIAARNRYIHGLVDLANNDEQKGIDALIQSVAMSADFTTCLCALPLHREVTS